MEIDNEKARFYVYIEMKRGKRAKDIHEALIEVYSNEAPAYSTVRRWVNDFSTGKRTSFKDETRCGRPITACGDDNVMLVKQAVDEDPASSVRGISYDLGLSLGSVYHIITEILQYRKIASYWVPMKLNNDQKAKRVEAASAILDRLTQIGEDRYDHYACEDETWIRFDYEETSSSSRVWLPKGTPRPQVYSNKLTPRKCLVMIVFTANKRINVQALPYGKTIDGETYAAFIHATGEKWRTLRSHPTKLCQLLWQHDNARPHIKSCVKELIERRGMNLIHQSPYSPDLNICDRWLNEYLKGFLRSESFDSAEEVQERIVEIMRSIDVEVYQKEIDKLLLHCQKVIDAGGEYITPQ